MYKVTLLACALFVSAPSLLTAQTARVGSGQSVGTRASSGQNRAASGETKEYRIKLSKAGQPGSLKIADLGADVVIEAYAGNEILITQQGYQPPPKKAEGMRSLTAAGVDNTGIGLEVKEANNTVEVLGVAPQRSSEPYLIKLPANVAVVMDYKSPMSGAIHLKNLSSKIEIDAFASEVNLEEITGPAVVNTVGGDINARFSKVNQNNPISIASTGGEIDVTLPSNTPANLEMSTMGGEIYTDMDVQLDQANQEKNMRRFGGQGKIKGSLNGGGVDIRLQSVGGTIYLRKK